MAPEDTALAANVESESPYQLDKAQTLKASSALLKHMKSEAQRKEAISTTKNLLAPDGDSPSDTFASDAEPLWLVLTTKKHIADKKRLKPGKIHLPHSLNTSPILTICLITADPQRPFKDTIAHPSFPTTLSSKVTRVIGISKLKARYKSFESKRQLHAQHDIFLADARIITLLPNLLGKVFYSTTTKRPLPVSLEPYKPKKSATSSGPPQPRNSDSKGSVAPPQQVAKEIERTLSCAQVHLSPAATTAVRVGLTTQSPSEISENIDVVVAGMVEKFIPKGWRNVRAIHLKGPNTMALPVWVTDELWIEKGDVLEEEEVREAVLLKSQRGRRRKGQEDGKPKSKKAGLVEMGKEGEAGKKGKSVERAEMSKEMVIRREKLREQKREIRADVEKGEGGKKRKGGADGGDGVDGEDGGVKVKKVRKVKAVVAIEAE